MAYGTVAQLREMLPQVPDTTANDALLATFLDRATELVEGQLGLVFAAYPATATARRFNARGGAYLRLPYYLAGSLTELRYVYADLSDAEIASTDYEIEADDHTALWRPGGWTPGRYEATAKWGYGPAPAAIVQVTLEIAVNLWRGRDRGMFSDVVGVEGGGAVGYQRALTNQQRMVIQSVATKYGNYGFA
jgi:hypothetical protein